MNAAGGVRGLGLHAVKHGLEALGRVAMACFGLASIVRRAGSRQSLGVGEVRRVLLIRLDLLGDVVFSLSALRGLQQAFPQARVDVLVLPYTAPVAARFPNVGLVHHIDVNRFRRPNGLLGIASLLDVVLRLRRQHYDVAVGLSGVTAGLFAALSGARWRVGYAAEAYWGCYNIPVAGRRYGRQRSGRSMHEVQYCMDLVRQLRADVPDADPALPLPGLSRDGNGLLSAGSYAVVVPGASNGSAKRWPVEYWSRLADRLAAERSLQIVISGSASERELASAAAARMALPCLNLAGQTSIEELMSLLAGASIVVAGDTGPLHLAAALGRPVVGIYGPTDPANTGPLGRNSSVLRLGLSCSPCYDLKSPAECKLPDRSVACMWGLTPERAYAEVCRVLEKSVEAGSC